jgi:DNA modification methylase
MTKKGPFRNKLNDLTTKQWIKFQKSWFVHDPPPRRKDVRQHPAKFPETLAQEFIEFFTKQGQNVLDPMAGTGSTLVACMRSGRHGFGIELSPAYAEVAREVLADEGTATNSDLSAEIYTGDARQIQSFNLPVIDYVFTSPPYWDMLHSKGAQTQHQRRSSSELDVVYSSNPADLGNIRSYSEFMDTLVRLFADLKNLLRESAYLTIIMKNVKKGGRIYPLAWDLARELSGIYTLKDEKIWCQDNIRLSPYGMGNAWVSNTFHHYCLQFRNEPANA